MENTNNSNRPKKRIESTTIPFENIGEIKVTTTDEISMLIDDLFSNVFADWDFCKLTVQQVQKNNISAVQVVPMLYFNVLPKEAYEDDSIYKAFRPLSCNTTNNNSGYELLAQIRHVSNVTTMPGVKVEVTQDGKDMLEEFMHTPINSNKVEWNRCFVSEAYDNTTKVGLINVDLSSILKKLFGKTDEHNSKLFYHVVPTMPINVNRYGNPRGDNWALTILRLNEENEKKAARLLGFPGYNQSYYPYNR